MCVDPTDPKSRFKREQIASLINLNENQNTIVEIYIMEEKTGKRHWELDPEDPNIYMEWLNGVNILRNKINLFRALSSRQQKAMYNSGDQQNVTNTNGNNNQQATTNPFAKATTQPTNPADRIIRTSSGKEFKASERPDLAKLANKPKKGYPRRSRSR